MRFRAQLLGTLQDFRRFMAEENQRRLDDAKRINQATEKEMHRRGHTFAMGTYTPLLVE